MEESRRQFLHQTAWATSGLAVLAAASEAEAALASAALESPLAHRAAAAVIPGAKSPEDARETDARLRTPVPEAVWAAFKSEGLIPEAAPTPD